MQTNDVRAIGRATQGVRLIDIEGDDKVVSIAKLVEKEDERLTAEDGRRRPPAAAASLTAGPAWRWGCLAASRPPVARIAACAGAWSTRSRALLRRCPGSATRPPWRLDRDRHLRAARAMGIVDRVRDRPDRRRQNARVGSRPRSPSKDVTVDADVRRPDGSVSERRSIVTMQRSHGVHQRLDDHRHRDASRGLIAATAYSELTFVALSCLSC